MNAWEQLEVLRKKISRLSTTAESQAWGALGMVLGYLIWSIWNKHGKPWISAGQLCLISYSLAVAVYAILARTLYTLKKCLLSARLLFLGEVITQTEYNKMRAKCLKNAKAV
jgi:hypothetical protein